jgi:APA family basic amino acid/polyamine antiporter
VGAVTVIGCVVFFLSLKPVTQIGFVAWNLIGVLIYLAWSSRNSRLVKGEEEAA